MRWWNPARVYVLTVFFKGRRKPVTERFYSIGDLLDALQEWEEEENFSSAYLNIED